MSEIGATLREARMRERIDVSEIEAKTKIRAKYLRALENEEWDLLPGPTFVKSFLRTYAQALGLDDKALLEEYKLNYEHPGDAGDLVQQPASAGARHRSRLAQRPRTGGGGARRGAGGARSGGATPGRGPSRAYVAAVGVAGLVIVLLLVGLLSGGGGSTKSPASTAAAGKPARGISSGAGSAGRRHTQASTGADLASLKLEPTGEVYVCLIGDGGRKRIPGVILKPGLPEPEYHARRFELTLGNNAVNLVVDGKSQTVPASSEAIGYAITRTGMQPLAAGELPTCT
jgi:transcriptional regulator with XRE-family HTH domain